MIHRSSLNPTIKTFRPIGNKVLMSRIPEADKVGSIIMPGNAFRNHLARFEVLAVGPKCETVTPGDTALAPAQIAFTKIELDGRHLEIADESLLSAFIPHG